MLKMLKNRIKQILISGRQDLFAKDTVNDQEIKDTINLILNGIIEHERISVSDEDKKTIIIEIINDLFGLGPVEDLLKDPLVTEIMINGPKKIYVERKGKKELSGVTFEDERQLMHLVQRLLGPTRKHIDESFPYTETVLRDGSRMNIVIPPLALNGPILTIRKFLREIGTIEDLLKREVLDRRMADFLIACMKAKINIIFSGATGSGKTTNLNVLSSHINIDERIITIEDTAELHLVQDNVVRLEAKQANIEGKGAISIKELFVNSLRMRPDRIIIGEIRGVEALDMLQAICSGHRGSLSIIHANSPQDVIYRIETMVLTSGIPISLEAINRQIAAAINLIIHQELLTGGARKITYITQVSGLKNGSVVLEDIFFYDINNDRNTEKPRWYASGVIPVFYNLFKKAGVDLSKELFNKD
jgi:pilus assembly protein CpaF